MSSAQPSRSPVVAERSLAERAYRYLYERLEAGKLAPGSRLVNRLLAEEIGVSVIPVREAIHRLASEGLIEHVPGSGAFVPSPSLQDLNDLYVLRDALESCAAQEAARTIREDELEQLDETLAAMQAISSDIAKRSPSCATTAMLHRWLDCEERFHEVLVESSRNELLCRVVREHRAVSRVFAAQRHDPTILTGEVAQRTCCERQRLLQALRDRDAEMSRRLMSDHIRAGQRTVVRHFRNRQVSSKRRP